MLVWGKFEQSLSLFFFCTVSPYDPDSRFSMSSLSRLEHGAGIKVITSLAVYYTQLMSFAGIALYNKNFIKTKTGSEKVLEIVLKEWETGKSSRPPTWQSLLDILNELDLDDLSKQIEDYLLGELWHKMYLDK